jgi:RimJ/RimL family protein N-acetyltransferase
MAGAPELSTARLVLRPWREEDREPFAVMNHDPAVMEFFPSVLSRAESDALVERFSVEGAQRGFCPWAAELADGGTFIGFVGLHEVPDDLAITPAVEVGWRLARPYWGRGLATEGATEALRFGFESLGLEEIVSFTSVLNVRSRRVMERLGMTRAAADDFEHPRVAVGHRLRPHVLYRLRASG